MPVSHRPGRASAEGSSSVKYRIATVNDAPLLARLNKDLIEDEGHANPMTVAELESRMRGWLAGEYHAVLFERDAAIVAYALYRPEGEGIYLRHLCVARDRRRQGIGREVLELLLTRIWPPGVRITVEALAHNQGALAFYRALGFVDYAVTLRRRAVSPGAEQPRAGTAEAVA
jgi:ribosomal protein S18 acetylase RimI-like enzyme